MTTTEPPAKELEIVSPEEEQTQTLAVVPVAEVEKLQIVIAESGVEATTAQQLLQSFRPIFAEVHKLVEQAKAAPVVTDATQLTEMGLVRTIRLALAKQRIAGEKLKDKLKADSLLRGKAIQGVYNVLEFMVKPLEESLLESEKFAERAEAARKDALRKERERALGWFGVDVVGWPLGDMPAAQYDKLLENTKLAHQAKIDAAAKVEADRIAKEKDDAEERERVRLENERLKKEAVEREAAAKAEREAAAAEAKRLAEIAANEKAEVEAKAKAEREEAEAKAESERKAAAMRLEVERRERAVAEAKAKAEREEAERKAAAERELVEAAALKERNARLKLEADAKALRDAEAAKVKADELAAKKAAAAPDKNKLQAVADVIRAIPMPHFSTLEGKNIGDALNIEFENLVSWIEERAASL